MEIEKTVLNFLSVLGVALMRTHTMGDLPNDARTHFIKSGEKERVILASLLLLKEYSDTNHAPLISCSE